MPRKAYSPESLIRAMDAAQARGQILGWQHNAMAPWKRGGTERPFSLLVDLVGGETGFELRTERETYVFVSALASAHRSLAQASSDER